MKKTHIELRSDTFTQPTQAMREAIFTAELGDDMEGEDPTVNRLEAKICEMLGKEAAVFTPSCTQSNQIAIWSHCRPGDELLIEQTGHIMKYEAGAPAILSGVSVRTVQGEAGKLTTAHLRNQVHADDQHLTPTRLLCLENTTNIGGGRVYGLDNVRENCEWAHERGLRVHMDGARLFNACVAGGYSPREIVDQVDSVSICFSKGLGCPVGSVLAGTAEMITRGRRARKIFGGAMRQAGILAAAALHALDHHVERLRDDHANAQLLARKLADHPMIVLDADSVETNMVFFEIRPEWGTAAEFARALREVDVRMYDLGPRRLRAVTHLDVERDEVLTAAERILAVASKTTSV